MGNNLAIALTESLDYSLIPPQKREEKMLPRWTIKRLVRYLNEKYDVLCCRETCRTVLKKLGFSWKKARKLLNKASKEARKLFVEKLQILLKNATDNKQHLVYIDEAHIHLDTDEGYGWAVKGTPFWVSSSSPGLQKVSFYGLYFYNEGKVNIIPYDKGNSINTIDILKRVRARYSNKEPVTLVWDGASYHRSLLVMEAAEQLNISIQRLPAYSPDFMPVEHLWQWLREDVTYHLCYDKKEKLIEQVRAFEERINKTPHQVADRLWTKTSLDIPLEELRFSN